MFSRLPSADRTADFGAVVAVSAADGTGERIILPQRQPGTRIKGLAWAGDGTALFAGVMELDITATPRIERIELADGSRTVVVERALEPAISPDGQHVAFIAQPDGAEPAGLGIARLDGSNRRILCQCLDRSRHYVRRASHQMAHGSPWRRCARVPALPAAPVRCPGTRRWPWAVPVAEAHGPALDIWSVPVAGGEPRQLAALGEDDPVPAWSPDGTLLAVAATRGL